ncbi:MAG TPA: hypothetical protein VFI31_00030 [Pirellulales bacterium]|nr:hypothetical protein [Pirellulales bacterium]
MATQRGYVSIVMGGLALISLHMPATIAADSEGLRSVPVPDDNEAWARLPPLERGERQPLPVWARILADSLPRTTAAMLELDALHRAHSPLGTALSAKVRRTVAEANRCAYGTSFAEADLQGAAVDESAPTPPRGASTGPREKERDQERFVLTFARRLTLAADTITDEEVARLSDMLGERKLVALVLLVAHANFQDRLLLALGTVSDLGEPLPPFVGRFAKVDKEAIAVPERTLPEPASAMLVPNRIDDPEWRSLDFAALQRTLDKQRQRAGRIAVPAWEDVIRTIPEDQRPKHPVRILWTLVCRGYQPELAAGWSACTRIFAEESKQDRVFEESVFWIVTRTIHCFY